MGRKTQVLNLREQDNSSCLKCHNRAEKDNQQEEGLCKTASSVLDGLPVRCVGEWAREKIHYLNRYLEIFACGMKSLWSGLNYIEICSGSGRCVLSKTAKEIDGTALSVLNNPAQEHLKEVLFIDLNKKAVAALNKRIAALKTRVKARAVQGDYKSPDEIGKLMGTLPVGYLNLVFIDPTQCDVPFSTIKQIANVLRNADLIINVFMGTDVGRNIQNAAIKPSYKNARKKYESFLGDTDFFQEQAIIKAAREGRVDDLKQTFIAAYCKSLAGLGYQFVNVKQQVRHYYWILFASKNKTGLDFWVKACKYRLDNQQEFPF